MILAALAQYYDRLNENDDGSISPPGYSSEKISYEIVLDGLGHVVEVNDLRELSGKNRIGKLLSVPASSKRPGTKAKSFFLWDKTSYVLGVSLGSKRSGPEHEAFNTYHQEAFVGSDDEGLRALSKFLKYWTPEILHQSPQFTQHGDEFLDSNVVFRLHGDIGPNGSPRHLHQRPAAEATWSRLYAEEAGSIGTCLVTGHSAAIARLHPAIKGVNGAQTSGASIVSFNLDSFTSYGKGQGENAPISERIAFAYTTALNHLLRRTNDNSQRMTVGDATVVFWAHAFEVPKMQAAQSLFAAFMNPSDDDDQETAKLQNALRAVRDGQPLEKLDPELSDGTQLFVLGLAPNASRISIRFWETGTLRQFASRLAQHYDDLRLEPSPWRIPPAVWKLQLASAPSREGKSKTEDVPPHIAGELTRAILTGTPYPYNLLSTIIMRMRADGDISGVRVALCKAILARSKRLGHKGTTKGAPPVSLDTNNLDPGYLLGRLFSALENTQRAALGRQINATIRDRYYGAASATPASVFPVLLRSTQHHLSRLRKDKPGFAVSLEKDITEIIGRLGTAFPRSLGIEAQGHFAIGYYHQTGARFAPKDDQDDAGKDDLDTNE